MASPESITTSHDRPHNTQMAGLIRYGGSPGLMYAESYEGSCLGLWVSAVKDLRYEDF